jgi:hypothetical protein
MGVGHPPELVERARILVETTTRRLSAIAMELEIGEKTLRTWIERNGWTRPPGAEPAAQRKIPPAKHAALQKLYEKRGSVADIAAVANCSITYIDAIAKTKGWLRRKESAARSEPPPKPPSADLAASQAALRDPALGREERLKLIEQAAALVAADALGGDRDAEWTVQTLTRAAALIRTQREDVAAPPHKDNDAPDSADCFPDANDLIEEIARRIEADCNAWLDPRILAAVAAAVP